ncbi:hypothetical protein VE04_06861 [Pseudogymnoascus sp. 24MN13]|nr:hypothetical protein VE04_06861 [Pseudogymnoascus sp. 24MN13]
MPDSEAGSEYEEEYASYTRDNGLDIEDEITKDLGDLTLSHQFPNYEHKPPPQQRAQPAVPPATHGQLPITYQLMVMINTVKENGGIINTGFGHHDFAARGSKQIARGGYFQTREVEGLGVAKYPVLATASKGLSIRSYKALANELRVLSHRPLMDHDNIVNINIIGWTRLDPCDAAWMPMIFLELAELGTLTQYLSEKKLEVDSKLQISRDVGSGLQALHVCGIMHGDLKLDNVLMFKGSNGKVRVKLSDFGSSFIPTGSEDPSDAVEISAGTRPWNSPELHQRVEIPWLPNVDAYSFGLLVWRVFLNGRNPFESMENDDIEDRKAQDLMIMDASASLEDEYDKNMLLRGALSSEDRTHLYMRGVAMPKRCFRHTLSSSVQRRDLKAAMHSLAFDSIYGTVGATKSTLDVPKPTSSTMTVEFMRLFDIPQTARTMFHRSLDQVVANEALPADIKANAYMQLCFAHVDGFGTTQDYSEAIRCLKAAAELGSAVAASVFRPLMLATGHELNPELEASLTQWLVKAIENGSLLARRELQLLDGDPAVLKKAEEQLRLLVGAKTPTEDGVAKTDMIDMMFLPANLGVMRIFMGLSQYTVGGGLGVVPKFMSPSMNTYLHAGAALGVDAENFRSVLAIVDAETINAQDDTGNTALILAVRFGNKRIAEALLEYGASASLANKRGETAWHWLISIQAKEDLESLALLMLDHVEGVMSLAKPRISNDNQYAIDHGGTPLHWAVDMDHFEMANVLLDCAADPLLEYRGWSPIDIAIQKNAAEFLELFLDILGQGWTATVPVRTLTDLIGMQSEGDEGAKHDNRDDDGDTTEDDDGNGLLIHVAATRPLHQRLIQSGPDWSAKAVSTLEVLQQYGYFTPWIAENGQSRLEAFRLLSFADATASQLVQEMIAAVDAFPDGPGKEAEVTDEAAVSFWKAALRSILGTSMPDMIHFAMDKIRAFSPTSRLEDADSLLHLYCTSLNADVSVLESILKDCSSIDCPDDLERTPLMNAVRDRNFEIATYLIEHGADVSRSWLHEGERMNILFEYVVNNTDVDVVPLKYLLEPMHPFSDRLPPLLVSPNGRDNVLHQACKDGNPVLVDYLLTKFTQRDQLNQPGEGGFTALHYTVFNGHADLAIRLCEAGADVNPRSGPSDLINRQRSRPLDLCFRWATQSEDFFTRKFGLERKSEDVYLGRLRIAEYIVRRHGARRANHFLVHRSLALKLALGAAQDGMTRLLAVTLRALSKQMDNSSHKAVDYPLILTNLLWIAAIHRRIAVARLLLDLGADVNARSPKGLSLLHIVAWIGNAEMVSYASSMAVLMMDLATARMVKSLGGYCTVPKARTESIIGIPLDFNPRFTVKFAGEPSDDEISIASSEGDRAEEELNDEVEDGIEDAFGNDQT